MVADIIRDSTIGSIINHISKGRLLPFPDQRPDFAVPARFLVPAKSESWDATTLCGDSDQKKSGTTTPSLQKERSIVSDEKEIGIQLDEKMLSDPYIVGWYGDDDPENPRFVLLWPFVRVQLINFFLVSLGIGRLQSAPSLPLTSVL